MKLAIANVAWSPAHDDEVAAAMKEHGFAAIEIAPARAFPRPLEATDAEIAAYRERWSRHGIEVVALQALLVGRPDLALFADVDARDRLADYLAGICALGGKLGAQALVFGAPKSRLRGVVTRQRANAIAVTFFRAAAREAAKAGTWLCMEANPVEYGCDFIATTDEARTLVHEVATRGFGLDVDTGVILMSGDDLETVLRSVLGEAKHLHLNEPFRDAVRKGGPLDVRAVAKAVKDTGYTGTISIDMKAAPDPAQDLSRVREALAYVRDAFA
jgi:D-psicose/D-tagatose/L-ribulose 3-epimerase